jgi:hypothetical protein
VAQKTGQLPDPRGDDGATGCHVLEHFQRRKVEALEDRVGRDGNVHCAHVRRHLLRMHLAHQGDAIGELLLKLVNSLREGALSDDVQVQLGIGGELPKRIGEHADPVPGFQAADEADDELVFQSLAPCWPVG